MADIIYTYGQNIYFNITNKCPCRCTFCIRDKKEAIGDAEKLFHKTEPTFEQIKSAIDSFDFSKREAAVFCGYGEPTNALENLLKSADYLKSEYPGIRLRLNTNGLSDLINKRETAKEISERFDVISVSLNAVSSEEYDEITRNIFPKRAFEAMLTFAKKCKEYGTDVRMSVVDVIGKEKVKEAERLAKSLDVDFVCRKYDG